MYVRIFLVCYAVQKKLLNILKNALDIEFGETTADGKFTLREVECLAACAVCAGVADWIDNIMKI